MLPKFQLKNILNDMHRPISNIVGPHIINIKTPIEFELCLILKFKIYISSQLFTKVLLG